MHTAATYMRMLARCGRYRDADAVRARAVTRLPAHQRPGSLAFYLLPALNPVNPDTHRIRCTHPHSRPAPADAVAGRAQDYVHSRWLRSRLAPAFGPPWPVPSGLDATSSDPSDPATAGNPG